MNVVYPAVFHADERGGYFVEFPDVKGAFTEGEIVSEGIEMAQEALGLVLAVSYIEKGLELPTPTPINDIKVGNEDFVTLIVTNPLKYAKGSKAVRKNVTVPEWLAKKAENAHINFSETLTEALYNKLNG